MMRRAGLPSFQSNVISIPAFQFDQGIILSSSGKEEEAFGRGRLLQLSQHKWANQSPPQVKSYLLKRQRILVLRQTRGVYLICVSTATKYCCLKSINIEGQFDPWFGFGFGPSEKASLY